MTKNRLQKQRIRSLAAQLNVPYTVAKQRLQQIEAENKPALRTFPKPPNDVPQTTSPLLLGYTTGEHTTAPWLQCQKISKHFSTVSWDRSGSETPALYIHGGAGTGKTYFVDAIEQSLVQHNAPFLRIDGALTSTAALPQQYRTTALLQKLQKIIDDSEEQAFAEPYTILIDAYGAVESVFRTSGDLDAFQNLLSTLLYEGVQRNVYMVVTSQYPVHQYEVFREILDTRQSILLPSRQEVEQHYGWEYHHGLGFLQNMPLKAFMPH